MNGARFKFCSQDSKLSRVVRVPHDRGTYKGYALVQRGPKVAATYVSIARTCPSSCPFKAAGCYANTGFTRVLGKALDEQAAASSQTDVVIEEVRLIDGAWPRGVPQDGARGGRDLRLHVAGETPSNLAARLLGMAAARWRLRGGGAVWTYTHNWRRIHRREFGPVSTLASVEAAEEVGPAIAQGYVPAVTVPGFHDGAKTFSIGRGWRAVPCPAEASGGVTCSSCRLCLDDAKLRERKLAIAFAVHGWQADRAAGAISEKGRQSA